MRQKEEKIWTHFTRGSSGVLFARDEDNAALESPIFFYIFVETVLEIERVN